jgi:hypothetical protein
VIADPVSGKEAFDASSPCPACGGHPGLPKGRGVRCAGFALSQVFYRTRSEVAGPLPLAATTPPAYMHRREGLCGCGLTHGANVPPVALRPVRRATAAPARPQAPTADHLLAPSDREEVYAVALTLLSLRPEARADLRRRGLPNQVIDRHGFQSIPRKGAEASRFIADMVETFGQAMLRRCPGFFDKNGRLTFWTAYGDRDGYVVPHRAINGAITGMQLKMLGGAYISPYGRGSLGGVHNIAGAGDDIYLTEGGLKGVVAAHLLGGRVLPRLQVRDGGLAAAGARDVYLALAS